ncbi:PX domain-containing protein EREX [Glycine soja]|uniref:PX domain-containing protein EREX n=1 Tax=Glycine soja TaxID=3848 RepID=A0A445GM46_GLYSO|nr:PX domain-containing protein EREX [Glycine soja]
MEKLLPDVDVSRSAPVAMFLELEAAARSSFHDVNEHVSDEASANATTPSHMIQDNSPGSVKAHGSSAAIVPGNNEVSELGTPQHGKDNCSDQIMDNSTLEHGLINPTETNVHCATSSENFVYKDNITDKVTGYTADAIAIHLDGTEFTPAVQDYNLNAHVKRLSTENITSDLSSLRNTETSNLTTTTLVQDALHSLAGSHEASRNSDLFFTFPLDEQHKLKKILNTQKQRLVTTKADVEDLIARLNQEMAARQYLVTKRIAIRKSEIHVGKMTRNDDVLLGFFILYVLIVVGYGGTSEEMPETEMKLKLEEDERLLAESTKESVIQEKQMLQQELDVAREELKHLQKHHDEFEMKSKTDMKVLIKEVKSLRSSELELKQQLSELMKEKLDLERILQKQKQRMENSLNANTKLLHECAVLQKRLRECSVNFLVE